MMLIYIFYFGCPGSIYTKDERAADEADFFGCLEVLNTDVSWASKIKNIDKHHI